MTEATRLTFSQIWIVHTFLIQSMLNILQPKYIMRQHNAKFMKPEVLTFKEMGRKRTALYVPIDEQILFCVKQRMKQIEESMERIEDVHVVMSGDHGKGAYRFITRILVWVKDADQPQVVSMPTQTALMNETYLTGWIGCKKDTRAVMEDSKILSLLNESMAKPSRGVLTLRRDRDKNELFPYWGGLNDIPEDEEVGRSSVAVRAIKVKLYFCADNEAVSMILGRDKGSGFWCNLCWKN